MGRRNAQRTPEDPAAIDFGLGVDEVRAHPLFVPLLRHARILRYEGNLCPADDWAVVTSNGEIHVHPKRRGAPREWAYVLAHCLLHLGFEHFQAKECPREWNAACDAYLARFLGNLKLGQPPEGFAYILDLGGSTEERLYAEIVRRGLAKDYRPDMLARTGRGLPSSWMRKADWPGWLAEGLAAAVTSAVRVAAGVESYLGAPQQTLTEARRARDWFVNSYPLLGALAASFEIIEDPQVCQRLQISVAAVDDVAKEIYVNPAARLDEAECRFVLGHELLHAGLRHQARCRGRDPFLWNVASDYVVNRWLVEMGVGDAPAFGLLHDPELAGLSAESIYDRITTDLRRFRKLATLRGFGLGDMLGRADPAYWERPEGMDLDAFYRQCLSQGLSYHLEAGRGLLPAGLVEEIRALDQPPLPWDVQLARWFDEQFQPEERRRTYARPSRRQQATPDIPRPRYATFDDDRLARTFGVVLDTSGSMSHDALARALGAIASYAFAHEVPLVRVVFCDAAPYDQGYLPPEAIADRVQVKGRGGTVLQPALNLLDEAPDFPADGPVLVITDGYCDRLHVSRPHAYLIPEGATLPFVPKGPVFRVTLPNPPKPRRS